MGWTEDELAAYQARRAGAIPRAIVQKREDAGARKVDHGPKEAGVDEPVHSQFRVAIEIRVSDERDRDNDGAVSTILDCLIAAIGRLAKVDPATQRKYASSLKRKRGR